MKFILSCLRLIIRISFISSFLFLFFIIYSPSSTLVHVENTISYLERFMHAIENFNNVSQDDSRMDEIDSLPPPAISSLELDEIKSDLSVLKELVLNVDGLLKNNDNSKPGFLEDESLVNMNEDLYVDEDNEKQLLDGKKREVWYALKLLDKDPSTAELLCKKVHSSIKDQVEEDDLNLLVEINLCLGQVQLMYYTKMNNFIIESSGGTRMSDNMNDNRMQFLISALTYFEDAANIYPISNPARRNIGIINLLQSIVETNNLKKKEFLFHSSMHLQSSLFQSSITSSKNEIDVEYRSLSLISILQNQPEKTVYYIKEVYEQCNNLLFFQEKLNLASSYIEISMYEKAIFILKELLTEYDCTCSDVSTKRRNNVFFCSILHNNMGIALELYSNNDNELYMLALSEYQVAIEINPSNQEAKMNHDSLEKILKKQKQQENKFQLDDYIRKEDLASSSIITSLLQNEKKSLQEITQLLEEFLNQYYPTSHIDLWLLLVDIKYNHGDYESAMKTILQLSLQNNTFAGKQDLNETNVNSLFQQIQMRKGEIQNHSFTSSSNESNKNSNLVEVTQNISNQANVTRRTQNETDSLDDVTHSNDTIINETVTNETDSLDNVTHINDTIINDTVSMTQQETKKKNVSSQVTTNFIPPNNTSTILPGLYEHPEQHDVEEGELTNRSKAIIKLAEAYLKKGKYQLASKQFQSVLSQHPNSIQALIGYATSLEKSPSYKNLSNIVILYTNATRAALSHKEANHKGHPESLLNQGGLAETLIRKALQVTLKIEKQEEALRLLKKLSNLAHTAIVAADIHYHIGIALIEQTQDNYDPAIQEFMISNLYIATYHDGNIHTKSSVALGRIELLKGNHLESKLHLEKALAQNDADVYTRETIVNLIETIKMNLQNNSNKQE